MTASQPFTPANGDRGRAAMLCDLIEQRAVGEHITYREAMEYLDCDDLGAVQAAMRDAMAKMERSGRRSVVTKRRFGWVVMRADEHIERADHHLTKAYNQGRRSFRKIRAIDGRRDELTQEQRQAADFMRLAAAQVMGLVRRERPTFAKLASRRGGGLAALPPMPGAEDR